LFKFFAWAERPALNGEKAKIEAAHDGYPDSIFYFRTEDLTALAALAMETSPLQPAGLKPGATPAPQQAEAVLYCKTYPVKPVRPAASEVSPIGRRHASSADQRFSSEALAQLEFADPLCLNVRARCGTSATALPWPHCNFSARPEPSPAPSTCWKRAANG
jgi:hypothetical protein